MTLGSGPFRTKNPPIGGPALAGGKGPIVPPRGPLFDALTGAIRVVENWLPASSGAQPLLSRGPTIPHAPVSRGGSHLGHEDQGHGRRLGPACPACPHAGD